MTEFFYGPWEVKVVSKDADFGQRLIIEGSDASDGQYLGDAATPPVVVNGRRWSIRFEWIDATASGWRDSAVRRTSATFASDKGLLVFLGVDDNLPEARDNDFNDVVMQCQSLDPALNPWVPLANPYEFTLPPKRKVRVLRDRSKPKATAGKKQPR